MGACPAGVCIEAPPPWAGGISAGVRDDTHTVRSVNVPSRATKEARALACAPAAANRAPRANPAKFLPLRLDRDRSAPPREAATMCALVKMLRFQAVAWAPAPPRADGTHTAE